MKISNIDPVTQQFIAAHPLDCSCRTISRRQVIFYLFVVAALLVLLHYRWDYFLFLVTGIMSFWYLGSALFRVTAAAITLLGHGEKKVTAAQLAELKDEELPVYSIFLPLYKEANLADKIIRSMEKLDYPRSKLDIKLLLEHDDLATINAVGKCRLPDYYDVIVVPDCLPKTKPRACNFGLQRAKGELCVIFDAEDRPDPDQLKKVAFAFRQASPELACIQAKLNYYNARQNLLTRLFAIEYSTTFDLLLAGMQTFNAPLPLGGTSNHFRTDILRRIGGWDPFNVTEDCDLGLRIYKDGYRTSMIDSTTWEEANSRLWNWVRQRSRWVKGFIQTHLTHTRNPLRTLHGLGIWGMLAFYLSVGASSLMMLVNVIYWIAGGIYVALFCHGLGGGVSPAALIIGPQNLGIYPGVTVFGCNLTAWPLFYSGPQESPFWSHLSVVFFLISLALFLANFLFVGIHMLACVKRRYYFLLPYCLLMPFYWVLISFGAWKGFIQLFTNPFYWEKTIHGLDEQVDIPVPAVVPDQPGTVLKDEVKLQ